MGAVLNREFFARDTVRVARELLGATLVREIDGRRRSGVVVETEAYTGEGDSACHASRGRTERTAVMFGRPGIAYVYFVYGMHFMLNVVTEEEAVPCAVLLRGLVPVAGEAAMRRARVAGARGLCDGPAKLCQAMEIDKALNEHDLTAGEELWFERHVRVPDTAVVRGPRVGIDYARPEDRDALWRFQVDDAWELDLSVPGVGE